MDADDDSTVAAPLVPEPPSYLEVVDSFPNLAPIVDFVVMDLDRQGQGQVRGAGGRSYKRPTHGAL